MNTELDILTQKYNDIVREKRTLSLLLDAEKTIHIKDNNYFMETVRVLTDKLDIAERKLRKLEETKND